MANLLRAEELYFVNEYIVSNRRERIRWELSMESRRSDCIWRFAHCARELLKAPLVRPVTIKNGELLLGAKKLLSETGNPEVFIMHFSQGWDRRQMRLRDALDEYLGSGPYVMIDCRRTFAFVETEPDCETHELLYLHRQEGSPM